MQEIKMPSAGQNVDQLKVTKWYKHEGDHVNRGDVLLEIETDKANLRIESFVEGTLLKIIVPEGEVASAGDVIAYIGKEGETVPDKGGAKESKNTKEVIEKYTEAQASTTQLAEKKFISPVAETIPTGRLKASPAAKKAARDLGIDVEKLYQTLRKSVIRRDDVIEYQQKVAAGEIIDTEDVMSYELMTLNSMRHTIAERMTQSATTIPSFTAEIEVDMEACIELRTELNNNGEGIRISYHDILAKCVAKLVDKYPLVNASFESDGIHIYKKVNVGIAVSVENGLVVPTVVDVKNKSLSQIALENTENISKARKGDIVSLHTKEGTFTISNLGMYPISRFIAIINPPQSCILALGSIIQRPIWINDSCIPRPIMTITASFDHRIVDGAYGAEFLKALKELMEHPTRLLL